MGVHQDRGRRTDPAAFELIDERIGPLHAGPS
jgi:hypothetical protein